MHHCAELPYQHVHLGASLQHAEPPRPTLSFFPAAEVVRSADLLSYTAEEGVRFFGEGQLLASDSFPGQDRTKLCLASKVRCRAIRYCSLGFRPSQPEVQPVYQALLLRCIVRCNQHMLSLTEGPRGASLPHACGCLWEWCPRTTAPP
jgi:hypothetical protein